jgi:adenosylcobinamide-phosphate synthase
MAEFLILSTIAMAIGYILDLIFGDPNVSFHPIRLIGGLISFWEKRLYKSENKDEICKNKNMKKQQQRRGAALVVIVIITVLLVVELVRMISFFIHPLLFVAVEAVLVWLGLAQTSLRKESMKVHDAFAQNDTEKARKAVSMIVGRDTKNLTAEGIMRAAVETVAENTSDGVTAPLIYCALFGSAGEYVYKAVNTMDSMVGYKNERYIDFGKCAAKLDDILNFIPSRISAVLMICASFLLSMDYKNAVKIFKRDRLKHASPNSAQTESVCAGALDLRLAGDARYGGVLFKKDFIGDEIKEINYHDIRRANRLMTCTGVLSFLIAMVFRALVLILS